MLQLFKKRCLSIQETFQYNVPGDHCFGCQVDGCRNSLFWLQGILETSEEQDRPGLTVANQEEEGVVGDEVLA